MIYSFKPYPRELQMMLTFQGFLFVYYRNLQGTRTDEEAYEATEEIYLKYFGCRKYSNYHTFKVIRARNVKR